MFGNGQDLAWFVLSKEVRPRGRYHVLRCVYGWSYVPGSGLFREAIFHMSNASGESS